MTGALYSEAFRVHIDVLGLVLGLVGPVSPYCDFARQQIRGAHFVSVWQHVELSVHIHS